MKTLGKWILTLITEILLFFLLISFIRIILRLIIWIFEVIF